MYQRILAAVDGSPTSTAALDEAIALAKVAGAKLCLIHVVDELPIATGFEIYGTDWVPLLKEAGAQILAAAAARVEKQGLRAETFLAEALGSRICDHVLAQARHWQADLIVVGTQGRRGAIRLIVGSNAEDIARLAVVPVLLVRGTAAAAPAPSQTAPANP